MGNTFDKKLVKDRKFTLEYDYIRKVKKLRKSNNLVVDEALLFHVINFLNTKGVKVDRNLDNIEVDDGIDIDMINKMIGFSVVKFFDSEKIKTKVRSGDDDDDGNDSDFKKIADRQKNSVKKRKGSENNNTKRKSASRYERNNRNGYSSDNISFMNQRKIRPKRSNIKSSGASGSGSENAKLEDFGNKLMDIIREKTDKNNDIGSTDDDEQKSNIDKTKVRNGNRNKKSKLHTNDRFKLNKVSIKKRNRHKKKRKDKGYDREMRVRLNFESDLSRGISKARKISFLCSENLRLGNMFGDLDCMILTEKYMEESELYVLAVKSLLFRDFQWNYSVIKKSLNEVGENFKIIRERSNESADYDKDMEILSDKLLSLNRSMKIFSRLNIENEFFMRFFMKFIFENYYYTDNDDISRDDGNKFPSIMEMITREYFSVTRLRKKEKILESMEEYNNQEIINDSDRDNEVNIRTRIMFNNKLKREMTSEEEQSLITTMIVVKFSSMAENSLNNSKKTNDRLKVIKSNKDNREKRNNDSKSLFRDSYLNKNMVSDMNDREEINLMNDIDETPIINTYGFLSSQLNNYMCGNLSRNFLSRSNKLIDKYRILCIPIDAIFSDDKIKSLIFDTKEILSRLKKHHKRCNGNNSGGCSDLNASNDDDDDDEIITMIKKIDFVPKMRSDIQKTMFLQIVGKIEIDVITHIIENDQNKLVNEISQNKQSRSNLDDNDDGVFKFTQSLDNSIYTQVDISLMNVIVNNLVPLNAYTKRDKDLMEKLYKYKNSCIEIVRYQKYQNSSALSHIDVISDANDENEENSFASSSSSSSKNGNRIKHDVISDARLRNANIDLEGTILTKKSSDFFGFNIVKIAKMFCKCLVELFNLRSVLYRFSMKDALIDVATKLINGTYLSNDLCQHVFDDNNRKSVFISSRNGNMVLKPESSIDYGEDNKTLNGSNSNIPRKDGIKYSDPSIRSLQNIYKENHPLSSSLLGLLARLDIKKDCVSFVFKKNQNFRNNVLLLSYLIENNIVTKSFIEKISIIGENQWYSIIYKDFFVSDGRKGVTNADRSFILIEEGYRKIFKDINMNSLESVTHINILERLISQSEQIFDSDKKSNSMYKDSKEMESFLGEFSDYGRRNTKKRHRLYPEEYITYSLVNSIHKRTEVFENYMEKEFYNVNDITKRFYIYIPCRVVDLIYPKRSVGERENNDSNSNNSKVNTMNILKNWCMLDFRDNLVKPFKLKMGDKFKRFEASRRSSSDVLDEIDRDSCFDLMKMMKINSDKLIKTMSRFSRRDFESIAGSIYDVLCSSGLSEENLKSRMKSRDLMNKSVLVPVDEDLLFRLSMRSGGVLRTIKKDFLEVIDNYKKLPHRQSNINDLYAKLVRESIDISKIKRLLSEKGDKYQEMINNGRKILYELIALNVQVMMNVAEDVNIIWGSVCNTFMFGGLSSTSNLISNRKCGESTSNTIDINQIIKQKINFMNVSGRKIRSNIVSKNIINGDEDNNILHKMMKSIDCSMNILDSSEIYRQGLLTNDWNRNSRWNNMRKNVIRNNLRLENSRRNLPRYNSGNNRQKRMMKNNAIHSSGYMSSNTDYISRRGGQSSNSISISSSIFKEREGDEEVVTELKYFTGLEISRYISKLNISSDCGNSIGSMKINQKNVSSSLSDLLSFKGSVDMLNRLHGKVINNSVMLKYLTDKIEDDNIWIDLVMSKMDISKINRPANKKGFNLRESVKEMVMNQKMKIMEEINSFFSISKCCRDGLDIDIGGLSGEYVNFFKRTFSSKDNKTLTNDFYSRNIHNQNQISSLDSNIFSRLSFNLFINDINSNEKSGLSCLFMVDGHVNTKVIYDQIIEKRKKNKGVRGVSSDKKKRRSDDNKVSWYNQALRNVSFSKSVISYNIRCSIANFIVFNLRFYPRFSSKVFIYEYDGKTRCEKMNFDFSKFSSHDLMSRVSFSRNGKDIIISYNIKLSPNRSRSVSSSSSTSSTVLDRNEMDKYRTEGVYLARQNIQLKNTNKSRSRRNSIGDLTYNRKYVKCNTVNTENINVNNKKGLNDAQIRHINGIYIRKGMKDYKEMNKYDQSEDILLPFNWNESICSPKVINCLRQNYEKKGFVMFNDVRMTSIVPSESTKDILSMISTTIVNEIPVIFSGYSYHGKTSNPYSHDIPNTCSPVEVKLVPCRIKISNNVWNKINNEINPIEDNNFTDDIVDHVMFSIGRKMFNKCNPDYYTDNISFGSDPYDRQYYRNSIGMNKNTNDGAIKKNKNEIREKIVQDVFMSRQSKGKIYIDNIKTEKHLTSKVDTISSFSICLRVTGEDMKSILDDWISTFGFWGIESTRVIQNLLFPSVSD